MRFNMFSLARLYADTCAIYLRLIIPATTSHALDFLQYMRNRGCTQRAFSDSTDSHDGTVGSKSIYSYSAKIANYEETVF